MKMKIKMKEKKATDCRIKTDSGFRLKDRADEVKWPYLVLSGGLGMMILSGRSTAW